MRHETVEPTRLAGRKILFVMAAEPEYGTQLRQRFTPLMTLYLTDTTDPGDLAAGFALGVLTAAKLYPAHATTNSAHGVTSMDRVSKGLEAMEKAGKLERVPFADRDAMKKAVDPVMAAYAKEIEADAIHAKIEAI